MIVTFPEYFTRLKLSHYTQNVSQQCQQPQQRPPYAKTRHNKHGGGKRQKQPLSSIAGNTNVTLSSSGPNQRTPRSVSVTCSAPGRGPCPPCAPPTSGWWRWGRGGCTRALPCQATGCSDTGSPRARSASLWGSPSDPARQAWQHTEWAAWAAAAERMI